uniref:Uncharacterized protein n=1 Tax=Knipowitschia caucasica TaxID=637954 RepID=A0AAV2LDT5_KNICA
MTKGGEKAEESEGRGLTAVLRPAVLQCSDSSCWGLFRTGDVQHSTKFLPAFCLPSPVLLPSPSHYCWYLTPVDASHNPMLPSSFVLQRFY